MKLYRYTLSSILFLATVSTVGSAEEPDFHGMVSPTFAVFACNGANCNYAVDSILQLHACGSAAMLGEDAFMDMIKCERFDTKADCVGSASPKCQWLDNDEADAAAFGPGACALGSFDPVFLPTGLQLFYETLRGTGGKDLPNAAEIYDCVQYSLGAEGDCTSKRDRKGRPCGWCANVATERLQISTPPLRNVCTHSTWMDVVCPQLQRKGPPCGGESTTSTPDTTTSSSSSSSTSSAPISTSPSSTPHTSTTGNATTISPTHTTTTSGTAGSTSTSNGDHTATKRPAGRAETLSVVTPALSLLGLLMTAR